MLRFDELPLLELKEIGFNRKKLLDLGKNLEYLMLGKRTEVLPISLASDITGEVTDYKARLSIAEENSNELNIHLVKDEFLRPKGITDQQFKQLEKGNVLKRTITNPDESRSMILFQKDDQTNELLHVKLEDINFSFTAEQLDDIQDGKPVEIGNNIITINLSNPEGFVVGSALKISQNSNEHSYQNNGASLSQ